MTRGTRRPGASRLALFVVFVLTFASGISTRAQSSSAVDPAAAPAIGSTFSPTLLRNLPVSHNLFSLLETTEGEVTSDRFYGGGLNIGRLARDGAFLSSWKQNQFFVGDVNVTIPNGGAPFLFPVLTFWDRVDVGSALTPFGADAAGFAVSLEPMRPAANWTRVLDASGSGGGLVAGVARPGPPAIETLTRWAHGSLLLSGPVSPRVGLVAAVDWSGSTQVERTGVGQADGQAGSAFANVVFTPNAMNEVRTLGWVQRTQSPFAAAVSFQQPLAANQTTFTHVQSTWERRAADRLGWRLFGAYSQAEASRVNAAASSPVVERLLDGPVELLIDSGDRTDRQWLAGARVIAAPRMYGGRAHAIVVGVDGGRSSARIGPGFAGAIGELVDGGRARMWQYSSRGEANRHLTTAAAFVSDRITFSPGRTLDAGVGYDFVNGAADGGSAGITWQNVLPRVLLRWKQGESSHVTWVAGYRRFADRLTLDTLAVGDPAAPTASVSRWTATGVGPVVARVGPGTGGAPTFSAIDPSLGRPTTDEVVAGIDVQLTPNIRGRITGVARRMRHLFNLVDVGAPLSSYARLDVIDKRPEADGGDIALPAFNRIPSTFGADRYLLTATAGQDTARFEGLILNADASVKRLTLMFNATASQTDGPAANRGFHADENDIGGPGELLVSPNATPSASGRLFFDRAFTLKLSAVYEFPHDVTLGAIARYQDGQPFSRVTVVPGLNQGTDFIRAYPAGDARFMYTGTLDVRLQKRVRLGNTALDLFVDAYNLAKMGNEVEERVVTGSPAFRDITAIQPPLAVHLGLRLGF